MKPLNFPRTYNTLHLYPYNIAAILPQYCPNTAYYFIFISDVFINKLFSQHLVPRTPLQSARRARSPVPITPRHARSPAPGTPSHARSPAPGTPRHSYDVNPRRESFKEVKELAPSTATSRRGSIVTSSMVSTMAYISTLIYLHIYIGILTEVQRYCEYYIYLKLIPSQRLLLNYPRNPMM